MSATTTTILLEYLDVGSRSKEAQLNTNYDLMDSYVVTNNAAIEAKHYKDMGEYTVAALPSAAANANAYALATNAAGGRTVVRSDGTNWKIIVVEGATVA